MTDHTERLRQAGEAYRNAREEADRLMQGPRDELTKAAQEAYADGMRKATILRSTGHVWSDTWLDKILAGVERKPKTDQQD